ncbi:sigma-70 family RNA polymerase sigma factor [Nocardiopsis sp. RSe5-2]|uniref:Sigma-70 family RNA polymerase sigma factor n=1 Tax=Nocardiopsis endophytica TaxID=3018445 RepID=A0ABT4U3E7_9ACTN|nr:sigma-70 family RNA polymerase sigma factor [Nocardiopsis endophytica]MDA2811469.1 sigma-70 family RNA polymerase sigma factor [Nocardiopsis endophytica]
MPPRSEPAALYDAHAAELYRYCWTLVGPDAAGDAVREALTAAAVLECADAEDLRPWLFALARTACRLAGFAPGPPFEAVPAAPDERPARAMWCRLPPSYRELLELHRRHGLAAGQIAKILGLDPETCAELCRAAGRRAADLLAEALEEAGRGGGAADPDAALELLEPPGPPAGLRGRVLRACTSPSGAVEREESAARMRPLGHDGFPLHRRRGPQAPPAADERPEAAGAEPRPTSLPGDRVTTADVPLPAGPGDPGAGDDGRHWPGAAVSGLVTVAVAVLLSAAAFWLNGPRTLTPDGTPPPVAGDRSPVAGSETGREEATDTAVVSPGEAPSPSSGAAPSASPAPSASAAPSPPGASPGPPGPTATPAPSAEPTQRPTSDPGAPTAPPDGGDGGGGDPVLDFFEDLADLLTP